MTIEFTILIAKVNLFCIYKNVEFVIRTWPKVSIILVLAQGVLCVCVCVCVYNIYSNTPFQKK
jgi:drug/metabolite transporter (DMT)-like permease